MSQAIVATAAAVSGDTIGYIVGRNVGLSVLIRYGKYVHITETRLRIGEYLFEQHGGKVVFFGRFVAFLRVLAALLAGASKMRWSRFAIANVAGALCWATLFATAAYVFGDRIVTAERPVGAALIVIAIIAILIGFILFRRYEKGDYVFDKPSVIG